MLNTLTIQGRLTHDPDLHAAADGAHFATFSIANDRDYDRDKTDFYDVICFGKIGDFACNFLSKGRCIVLRGHLTTTKWTDRNGSTRKDVKIVAENIYFADYNKSSGNNNTTQKAQPDWTPDVSTDEEGEVPF